MTEIFFYRLSISTLEEALALLLERCMERNWRVLVKTGNIDRRNALDQYLWTYRDNSFLPHGTDEDAFATYQPILLSTEMVVSNKAQICFILDGSCIQNVDIYERVIFLFDSYDQVQIDLARASWRTYKEKRPLYSCFLAAR